MKLQQEIKKLEKIFKKKIKDFNENDWYCISQYQKLSEKFIEKHENRVYWNYISIYQKLSEKFIEKYEDKINWNWISINQKLSERFIEKHEDRVYWDWISENQKLSEEFIEKHEDRVDWSHISQYQKLSEKFIEKYKDRIDVNVQMRSYHDKRTEKQKEKEILEYCKKYNLKVERKNRVFYAYREHDKWGRGKWNKTISYRKGRYYRDWHCDLDPENKNSFGLGIFPKGNIEVKVKFEDWGVVTKDSNDGKARVWGFEIV